MGFSINFPAEFESNNQRRVLRLQLGKKHGQIEGSIQNTCSNSLRKMLEVKNFEELKTNAKDEQLSLNAYALQKIEGCLKENPNNLIEEAEGTYRGKTDDFFHHLFPYLEAFSPNFVTTLCNEYAPDATVLLDPFGGLGTAPFAFAGNHKQAYYCEINPLMQHIAKLKCNLRETTQKDREDACPRIRELISNIEDLLSDHQIDVGLQANYKTAFKGSNFFSDFALDQTLRFRTWIDQLYNQDKILAVCLELSVLASLVTASEMQRAGDLRKKRASERQRVSSNLCDHVATKLASFEQGLLSFDTWGASPRLLTEDSRTLNNIPTVNADVIITSPPYLNGTNYFRNTKIELWFIRVIQGKDDIGKLREKAITAGINDVRGIRSRQAPPSESFAALKSALHQLDKCAYDRRIPQMIKWYGHDLNLALSGSIKHLIPNGVIAVDIGDSIYCGVLVPTDALVEEVLAKNGCQLIDNLVVRKRTSRLGAEVKQVCLVAKKKPVWQTRKKRNPYSNALWSSFKSDLPHKKLPFSKRNWGHANHSLCSYQGKLKPAIAKFLTDAFVPEGGSMLDPFSGVGTIPFEAALQGKSAFGFDISPAAVSISKAKLSIPQEDLVAQSLTKLDAYIQEHKKNIKINCWTPDFNKRLSEYYHSETLKEILCARDWFHIAKPWNSTESLLLACCMHVLHGNRPYALSRRSHPITPFSPSGDYEDKSLIEKLKQKVDKAISVPYPCNFLEGKAFFQDATETWPLEVENLDAIITSPPFYNSTRFYLANWIRLWFAGWNETDFNHEPNRFIDERQKATFDCYDSIVRSSKERLKSDGILVLHLGKSKKCDMAEHLLNKSRYWFSNHEIFGESVSHCESHGIRDKGGVTEHQYLLLY